jgi:hypothetical protein
VKWVANLLALSRAAPPGIAATPHRDDMRHHVYSVSPAKRFEIRLRASVCVVESPSFGETGKDATARGAATFTVGRRPMPPRPTPK